MTRHNDWLDGLEVIDEYTRADAIEDGVLIEVPAEELAAAGFGCPVAFTSEAWFGCIEGNSPDGLREEPGEPEKQRLRDVLRTAVLAAASERPGSDRASFAAPGIPRPETGSEPEDIRLVACLGLGDAGEPVITIMRPGED